VIAGEVGRSHTHSRSNKAQFYQVNKGFLTIKEVGSPENPMLFHEVSLYDFNISV